MNTRIRHSSRIVQVIVVGVAALGFLIAPAQLAAPSTHQHQVQQCYPGFLPGNPYLPSCNVGPRQPKPPGGTPDQTAVIACRGWPGCLSWYINNPH